MNNFNGAFSFKNITNTDCNVVVKNMPNENNSNFKIIQINAQSLTNKLNQIEVILHNEKPHILVISEHWCNTSNINFMAIKGYTIWPIA